MEDKFVAAWLAAREKAAAMGIKLRPMEKGDAMKQAHFYLSGHRASDGFDALVRKGQGKLTLEALAVDKRFTALFSDEEANTALQRLLEAQCF